jgi:hypothetical protein
MDSLVVKAKAHGNTKKGVARSIEIACKRLSWRALKVIEEIMENTNADPKVRMDAAKEIMNRGWGRPKASIETNINVGASEGLLEALSDARKRTSEAAALPNPDVIEAEFKTVN